MTGKPLFVYAWGLTDVGKKREANEDNLLIADDINLFVVADGMGGHAGGEVASRIAVETVEAIVRKNKDIIAKDKKYPQPAEDQPVAKLLSDALRGACHAVHEKSVEVKELQGMGTTTTALVVHDNLGFIAHVGDSRAYLCRDSKIVQLSEDHSLVYEQLKAGLITQEQARQSRFRNIITRSIGFEDDVDVDMVAFDVADEDTFLLCTDGLSTLVTDQELNDVLIDNPLHEIPQLLVDLANSRGGDDNVTIIVAHVSSKEQSPDSIRLDSE